MDFTKNLKKKTNSKTQSYGAEQITVLEGLAPVRKRPGMYIGKLGDGKSRDDGVYILIKESMELKIGILMFFLG